MKKAREFTLDFVDWAEGEDLDCEVSLASVSAIIHVGEKIHVVEKTPLTLTREEAMELDMTMDRTLRALQMMIISWNGSMPGHTPGQVFQGAIEARNEIQEAINRWRDRWVDPKYLRADIFRTGSMTPDATTKTNEVKE